MFIENAGYPFTNLLESAYPQIREELDRLPLDRFKPWYEKDLYTNLWLVYGFYAFGKKLEANCEPCPNTVAALEMIPDLVTAGFSVLLPGTHIKPHRGYTGAVLRCHLGLQVPEAEKCVLKVHGVERSWQEGKCLIFDDTSIHEAWNNGQKPRIVLLLDFKNKKAKLPMAEKIKFSALSAGARLMSRVYESPGKKT